MKKVKVKISFEFEMEDSYDNKQLTNEEIMNEIYTILEDKMATDDLLENIKTTIIDLDEEMDYEED